jgi:16S rRNA processing protein RimM
MPATNNLIEIGRILKPRGIHGEVKVQILCDSPEHFDECLGETGRIYAWPPSKPNLATKFIVEQLRFHDGCALIHFQERKTIEDVENLRGYMLGLPLEELPPPGEETYYFHELEGLDIYDETGTQIGTVQAIEENPAHPILLIRATDGTGEFRAPWVSSFVKNVDLEHKRVEMCLPPGLRDL